MKLVEKVKHIAVIMDGNARYANKNFISVKEAHSLGAIAAEKIIEVSYNYGVKYLTLYCFSTENWARPEDEVFDIIKIINNYLIKSIDHFIEKQIKVLILGDITKFDQETQKNIEYISSLTKDFTNFNLNLAIGYGARSEIINATKKIAENIKNDSIQIEDINEALFKEYLYIDMPDPDLLIRTGGNYRISNFLLWQIAYSEIYISDTLWPQFTPKEFTDIIENFLSRTRTYGTRLKN